MGFISKAINTITQNLPSIRNPHTRYTVVDNTHHPITYNRATLQTLYDAQTNPVVFRCNKVFKNTALACDFNIDTDTMEQDNLPTRDYLNRLFRQPEGYGTQTTWADMNALIWDSKDNLGDCFFEVSTDSNHNILNGFTYIHNSSITWSLENECYCLVEHPEVQYEPDDIVHIRDPNNKREDSPWGISKLSRAADYVALFKNAMNYNNDVLWNDGVDPNLIFSFDKDVNIRNAQAELDRLEYDKKGKRRKFLALKGVTVQHTAYSNKDMHYLDLLRFAEDGIIRTYGVPPQLYGKIESGNLGSGSGESQKKDWKLTFDGERIQVEDAFNNCLKQHGFNERFHYQEIDIVDQLYDAQVAEIELRSGIRTIDEIRNERGLDKLEMGWAGYYR